MKKTSLIFLLVAMLFVVVACQKKVPEASEREEQIVKAFVAYLNTQEGKATIKANDGIVSITANDPSWTTIKVDHEVIEYDNSDITIKFGGSTSVEKVAKALSAQFAPLAGNFKPVHNHTGSGDAYKRTHGEEKDGANSLHIGFASRAFSSLETVSAQNSGQLALDAVVAVVHTNNTLANITAAQLKNIYDGTLLNWTDLVGAAGSAIKAYTRDTSSGTREAFFSGIKFSGADKSNEHLVEGFIEVESNGAMMNGVKGDANGIGYISLSGLATSGLKGLSFEGVAPTEANVLNNTYALKRPFMYVIRY